MKSIKEFRKAYVTDFSKQEISKMAKVLKAHMEETLGGEWEIREWQNSGYHFEVHLGSISLHYSTNTGQFHCYVNDEKNRAGVGAGMFKVTSGTLPEVAVIEAVNYAYQKTASIMGCMDDNVEKLTKFKLANTEL